MLACALAGCSTSKSGGEPTQSWFDDSAAVAPTCTDAPQISMPSLRVDIFISPGIDRAHARRWFAAFVAHAKRLGIPIVPGAAGVRTVAPKRLFTATRADVEAELGKKPGRDETAALLVRPVREFLRAHAPAPVDRIVVVYVDEIVPGRSALAAHLRAVAGLAFSTLAGDSAEGAELSSALGVPVYRPTIFLAAAQLARMSDAEAADVAAHELGHALGLEHTTDPTNLMARRRQPGCSAAFSREQLQMLAGRIAGFGG